MTFYTEHLKSYAAKNGLTYKQAMSDAGAKDAYATIKAGLPPKEKKVRIKKVKTEPVEAAEEPVEETKPKKVVRRKAKPKVPKEPEQEEIFQSD